MAFKKRKLHLTYNPFQQFSRKLKRRIGPYSPRCRECDKPLSDPTSIRRGIGPECWRKYGIRHPVISRQPPVRLSNRFGPPDKFKRFVVTQRPHPVGTPKVNKVASNVILKMSSAVFLQQYAHMIHVGRMIYSHRNEIKSMIDSSLSDSSLGYKIENVVSTGKNIVQSEAKSVIASTCAEKIAEILDSTNVFSKLNETTGLSIYRPQSNFKNFFQSTATDLIQGII